jgi:NAD(P)-dependent dehydrogenase (short-subunit alcohol dehydrogenase family)
MANLRDRVVVVTGASSGLGRAVAIEMAGRGARLVLAARRGDALEDTARVCRSAGGDAIVAETDVTVESDVDALAAAAIDAFGRIDVWINNAGVTLFAPLDQAPFELHQRVIETNLLGAMLGARAALPVFRRQRSGVLINVGSVLAEVGHAFVPSYVISKFGIHGLSEALRVALADEPNIHVCTVFPYSIDTPHFEAAANEIRRKPFALPPMQPPERVARAIADLAERPRRTRHVPRSLVVGLALHALMPRAAERLLLDALRRWHISDDPQRRTAGNLFAPPDEAARTHGQRPPLLATSRFFAWAALRLVRIEVEHAMQLARRARAWLTSRRHEALQPG